MYEIGLCRVQSSISQRHHLQTYGQQMVLSLHKRIAVFRSYNQFLNQLPKRIGIQRGLDEAKIKLGFTDSRTVE